MKTASRSCGARIRERASGSSGGITLSASDFTPVTSDSPVWHRLDDGARDHIVQIDLGAAGVTDFGALARRGFCHNVQSSPPEISVDGEPMTLARWPDIPVGVAGVDPSGDSIEVYGSLTPDVTGSYTRTAENDGVSVFQRDGSVDGVQYYLRRTPMVIDGRDSSAWFLTSEASGVPTNAGPWWAIYDPELGVMSPGNGALGDVAFEPDGTRPTELAYVDSTSSGTAFTYAGDRPSRWTEASDVWFHGWWKYAWADCRVRATNIDASSRTVTLADDTGYGIQADQPYYAFNLLEEITVPGEYYLDRDSGILYLYPPHALDGARIVLSQLDADLVHLSNTQWIQIRDVTFESGRAQLVNVEGGNDNLLDRVTLENGGGPGARITGTRNGIQSCEIHGTATHGAILSGGDRPTLDLAENFVRDCRIHHFGRTEWTYRPGVSISGAGMRVSNNLIYGAPHAAILYGGNEHTIAENEIHDVCRYSSDAGAVYAGRDWGARGNEIRNNFIHHLHTRVEGYGVHGVYMDDCLSGIHVHGNVFYAVSGHAVQHGGGRDDIVENNLMVSCGDALAADSRGYAWRPSHGPNNTPGDSWNLLEKLERMNYQADPWLTAYPAAAAIPDDWSAIIAPDATWLYPEGSTFDRNLGYHNGMWMRGGSTFDHYASVSDNVEDADPMFTDQARLDLSLQSGSPALAIPGFQPIPFDAIGPH